MIQLNSLYDKSAVKYILLNLASILIFGVIYYRMHLNIVKVKRKQKKLNTEKLHTLKAKHTRDWEVANLVYKITKIKTSIPFEHRNLFHFLWFSLVTQTTIGYGSEAYLEEETSYKIANAAQMLSIFLIIGLTM